MALPSEWAAARSVSASWRADALRLEQTGVLDRDCRLGGEGGRNLGELLVVEVGLELVDADHADDAVADDHRRADPAANAGRTPEVARKVRVLRDVGEDLCSLRPHDLAVDAALVVEVEALPEQGIQVVEAAAADDHQAVSLDHLDGAAVVGHDSLQLADDRLDRVLEAQRLPSTWVTVRSVSACSRARWTSVRSW